MVSRNLMVGLAVAVAVSAGITVANHDDHAPGPVKVVAVREIVEKVDGQAAKATAVEVTLKPGEMSPPHRHPGPVLGYVLEGEYEWAIDDQPSRVLKAGETFYEPMGCLHRVSKNAGKTTTRVLAWVIQSREGTPDLVLPASEKPQP